MLRTWFRWRGGKNIRKKTRPIIFTTSIPKTRQLQDTEVYSKLFYESKLKSIVEAEIAGEPLTHGKRLVKVVEVTKREWARESEEIKKEVRAKKEELEKDRKPVPAGELPGPKQRQTA